MKEGIFFLNLKFLRIEIRFKKKCNSCIYRPKENVSRETKN